MEYKGLLSRVHGGAIRSYKPYYNMNLNQRMTTNQSEKKIIANKIVKMIENHDTIMLNSGTTTLHAFRMFPPSLTLSIVTNSIQIALEGADNPNYNIILLGGHINSNYQFTFGDDAINQLKNYHADKLILSVDGVDIKNGYSTYYDKEAEIDRIMINNSNFKIIAADRSKFCRTALSKISDLSTADCIVTNAEIPKDMKEKIIEKGITIY